MKNYYEQLEVNSKASLEIIEKAYRVLAKRYHPDLQREPSSRKYAEDRLKEINEAYRILSDTFLREQYDSELAREQERRMEALQQDKGYSAEKSWSPHKRQKEEQKQEEEIPKEKQKVKVGTFSALMDLVTVLYKDRPKREELKEMTKKDFVAVLLTIIIVILVGIVLWIIPFTNAWMRELIFENPLFNWIGNLFS